MDAKTLEIKIVYICWVASLSLDKKFHNELEKIRINYENETHKVLGKRIELKLIPGTQFIYTADFLVENELFVGCFPISIYDNPYGGFLGGKKEPLPGVVTLGTLAEGTVPTSIIAKTVKTGFMSSKRVFLSCISDLVDLEKGCFRIDPEKIYKEQRGFTDNPLVGQLNDDKWLIDRIQKIPNTSYKNLDWTGKRSISNKIDDAKKDLVTIGQIISHKKMTLAAFQCMPDWQKNKPLGLDLIADIEKRICDYIRKYGSSEERTGTIAQPWINGFLQVLLHHLKIHKPNLPETKKILQNFAA
jgi:hypothetical protein